MSDQPKAVAADVFDRHAKSYHDSALAALARGETAGRDLMLEWLDLKPGERVLELGCGPGIVTVPLARAVGQSGRVVAVDLAPNMLALLRQVAPPNVDLMRLDVTDLGHFGAAEFDAVAAGFVLQFCPDLDRVLAEIHRVLRASGRLAATVPAAVTTRLNSDIFDRVRELLPPHQDADMVAPLMRTRMRISDEHAVREALAAAGFREVRLLRRESSHRYADVTELLTAMDGWWDWAGRLDRLPWDEQDRVRKAALADLRRQFGEGPVEVPGVTHIVHARG